MHVEILYPYITCGSYVDLRTWRYLVEWKLRWGEYVLRSWAWHWWILMLWRSKRKTLFFVGGTRLCNNCFFRLWICRTKEAQEVYERALFYDSSNPDIYYNVSGLLILFISSYSLDVACWIRWRKWARGEELLFWRRSCDVAPRVWIQVCFACLLDCVVAPATTGVAFFL